MSPEDDVKRTLAIIDSEVERMMDDAENASGAIRKAMWRAINRELMDRISQGWQQCPP